ncbi:hypothetical protein CBR_g45187 [Chara braunii]|uniref:Reverse transcriptase domain-containing protein n=1 Tax=Chara braunii TaxID=69332 RepID=A0A388K359_CHABU|nr:hypothetical protein CBR_g45187 [Chara braunii]|eukprot:GBG64491.1 hypothetical protein CBR_g45187 [Chara braunii]
MVETRGGTSTIPYTQEQQEKMAAIVRENRERKELLKQAKLKAIAEEQAAKMKELEEEMGKKKKAAEEEAAAEAEEERKRKGKEAESSGAMKEEVEMEKKISEWIANLSLGEDEEAEFYVPKDERDALASELVAMEDPLERREREEEKKLEWKLRMKREKKKRREEVNRLTAEVAKVQDCRREVGAQADVSAKIDKMLGYLEVLSAAWMEERQANWSQKVALGAMQSRFRDFARDMVTHVGGEWRSARALKGTMDDLVALPDHGVTETQLVQLFYRAMPEALRGHFFYKSQQVDITYDALSREVVLYESKSMPVTTFWHKDLEKGKRWKGRTIFGQVMAKDHMILTLEEGGTDEVPYSQIEWGLEEEDSSMGQGRSYVAVAAGGRPQGRGGGQGERGQAMGGRGPGAQGVGGQGNRQAGDNRTMRVEDYVEGVQAYFRLEKNGKVKKVLHSLTILVQDDLPFDVVLGMDWGEAAGAALHLREHECRLPSPLGEVKNARLFHVSSVDNTLAHCCLSAPAFARLVKKEQLEEQVFVVYVRPVTEAKKEDSSTDPTIAKLLEEFKDLTEAPKGVVPRPIQHRIEIEPGSRTPKGAVYTMSPRELEELRKQLDELLEKGWSRPSSSPFGAPVLLVPKKEGELRMCIDYRGLNAITVKNAEPLPRIDDLLDRVPGCKYFSKIDLKSGYHQIEVHPDDQYKTAFRTRYGHYEFIVMPFGLTNTPATFQRCMNDLFRPWLDKFVVVYLDDILVFSKTLQEHQSHLRQVLEKLREANLKINAKKCEWAKTQVLYLGHVLDGDGIKPEDSKIAAIRDWPTPRTLTELRSFLGLANYYRKFVRDFSTIVAPLRRLLKKEAIWQWDKDCTSALKRLKRALIEYPVLKVADPSLPFVVTTDASQYGIGAVLQQDDGHGYRPVEFMSARMPSEKVATSTYERELYALRQALDHWKHYLLGRHFKVYSDHETLRWLKTQAKMTPKLTRWAAEIDQYDFELKPVKGKYNVVADALSRRSDYFGAIVHYLDIGRDQQEKVKQAYAQLSIATS